MENKYRKHPIFPLDFVPTYVLKRIREGKQEITIDEVVANIPKTNDNPAFKLCLVSESGVTDFFRNFSDRNLMEPYLNSIDGKTFTVTERGKEYFPEFVKRLVAANPHTAKSLCLSLGTDINDLLPFAPFEAKVKAADPVQGRQIVSARMYSTGVLDFIVKTPVNKVTNQGIEVFSKGPFIGGDKSLKFDGREGCVMPGSDWSGAIWHNDELIGEYERCGHIYLINPVSAAGLRTNEIVQKHPLDYLLKAIVNYYEDMMEYSPDT
ncbi:MAG: hypothetical protein HY363_02555 [Candidatus Aenigmarchaeota archaeon]|nr:hypothetical protein [Candidatus Aenigmarchaeota archaeon]